MKRAQSESELKKPHSWRVARVAHLLLRVYRDWKRRAAEEGDDLERRLAQLPPHG